MRKKIRDEFPTKAKKREFKKRPRMQVHGRGLAQPNQHAGKKLTNR